MFQQPKGKSTADQKRPSVTFYCAVALWASTELHIFYDKKLFRFVSSIMQTAMGLHYLSFPCVAPPSH